MTNFESIREQVEYLAEENCLELLETHKYNSQLAIHWCNDIAQKMVKALRKSEGRYKWFVTAIIVPKGDSGLSMSGACLWDSEKDGSHVKKIDINDMICIVQTFFVSI